MKNNDAYVVKTFSFTKQQSNEFAKVLPRCTVNEKVAAILFIEKARSTVERWKAGEQPGQATTANESKQHLQALANASAELKNTLDVIPNDIGRALHATIVTQICCKPNNKHESLSEKLRQLGISDPLDIENSILMEILSLVNDVAIEMGNNITVKTGVDTDQLIGLVANLADHYCECFQKEPKAGNNSNFREFVTLLGECIYYSIGVETVKSGLAMRKKFRNTPQ